MVVMKFGGSSVDSAAAMARVRAIVAAGQRPRVVVVSALGGVTDALLALAAHAASGERESALELLAQIRDRHAAIAASVRDEAERSALGAALDLGWTEVEALLRSVPLSERCPPAASDAIVAQGELASSRLVTAILRDGGLPAEWIDARDMVVTDDRYQHATPLAGDTADRLTQRIGPLVARGAIPVLGGFIGATRGGNTTTLGRGGSDYSASLIGACLGAAEIQIWTDVDGILTADPRLLSRARPLARLSFDEASALARFGAKVLHPSTLRPAARDGIPVRVLNSRRPARRGTLVSAGPVRRTVPVAGVACLQNLCAFEVPLPDGTERPAALAAVFNACARAEAVVHLASVTDLTVSVVIDDGLAGGRLAALLASQPHEAVRRRRLALVAVVGDALAASRDVAWRALAACRAIPVHLVSRVPGSNHLALVIDQADAAFAVAALHERFVEHWIPRHADDSGRGRPALSHQPYPRSTQEVRA